MDTHDVGRDRGGVQKALASIQSKACVIGIGSDILYPLCEQMNLAENIPNCEFHNIDSPEGHDGFLLQWRPIQASIISFLDKI